MKFFYCLLTVLLGGVLLVGCGKKSDHMEAVKSKLNSDGSYYLLADQTMLGSQLEFMLDRIDPAMQKLLKDNNIPFTYAELRKKLEQGCKIAGLDQIKAYGASSIVLSGGKNNQPYFFHNRWTMVFGGEKLPAFMLPFSGKKIAFADFAAQVPDNVVSAGIMPVNLAELYKFLKAGKYLPENSETMLRSYLECDPEKFLSGISGEVLCMMFEPVAAQPQLIYIINDQDNRLFKLCGKYLLFDADKLAEYKFPATDIEVVIRKKVNKLQVFIGNGVAAGYDRKIAAKQTMGQRAELTAHCATLPMEANGFGISCYFNTAGKAAGKLANVSAMLTDNSSVTLYYNSYCDWNGFPFEVFANVIPELENLINMAKNN